MKRPDIEYGAEATGHDWVTYAAWLEAEVAAAHEVLTTISDERNALLAMGPQMKEAVGQIRDALHQLAASWWAGAAAHDGTAARIWDDEGETATAATLRRCAKDLRQVLVPLGEPTQPAKVDVTSPKPVEPVLS